MEIHTSAVIVYMLHLIQSCKTDGSLVCTHFQFHLQSRIQKATKKEVKSVLECAVRNSIKGDLLFTYNPYLRLCILGASEGMFTDRTIPDKRKRWLIYLKSQKATMKEVEEQHPAAKEEKVDVLYQALDKKGTLLIIWYHVAMLDGDIPSAKIAINTSVLIPGAETVCYNKGNNKLYIIYNRSRFQELFSRGGIQGTDDLETRINGTICGRAKILRIDYRRQKYFLATDKGICAWDPTSPQNLIIKNKNPWRIELDTHKMDIYFIDESKKVVLKSSYEGRPPTPMCISNDIMGLAVDLGASFFYTCSLRVGVTKRCSSPTPRKKDCMSIAAWKGYLFMINTNGLMECVSLDKKVVVKTNHISVATSPGNMQILHED